MQADSWVGNSRSDLSDSLGFDQINVVKKSDILCVLVSAFLGKLMQKRQRYLVCLDRQMFLPQPLAGRSGVEKVPEAGLFKETNAEARRRTCEQSSVHQLTGERPIGDEIKNENGGGVVLPQQGRFFRSLGDVSQFGSRGLLAK